ncbi:MAG: hypothetical protein JNN29_03360 [Chitinophagaceae bacterium]|nr:hypothetical protein [Chitinophagaceae bacterium]
MEKVFNYFKIATVIALLSLTQLSCRSDRSKRYHSTTIEVCGKALLVEKYVVSGGGAFGGDRVSDYLTDSSNFRIYIGTFDNANENFTYECKGDSIYIEKISIEEEGIPYKTKTVVRVIEKRVIDLNTLRNNGKFE